MEHLKRLILLDPRLEDLGAIGIQPTLEELSLIGCERHVDLAALPNLPGLEVLNFQCFDRNLDLKPLTSLEDLKWLGLPPTTTQEQLENIVRDHPNLIGLELFQTDSIVDLTSIRELQKLKYLVVGNQHAELDPLFTMKGLRWLAIASKDKEVPRKLQIALPGTAVVLVRPVCLGSGWILLLAPGVLLARCVKKRRRKPAQKGDGV